jgi:Integrase core domain
MRQPKIGYDYVHSLVDDHSRLAYSKILTDEIGTTCAAFLLRATAYFAAHGIPRIERLINDNALAYRHSTAVKQAVAQLGAQHKFIKPHSPGKTAKSRPFNRTLQTKWAYRRSSSTTPESRLAEGHPKGPGPLTPARTAPPSPAGMPDTPRNATMSRDTC